MRPDADLNYAVAELVDGMFMCFDDWTASRQYAGAFYNSGQSCCAVEVSRVHI